MRVYFDQSQPYGIRVQPWDEAEYAEGGKYYDFRKDPGLIPEVLEDFVPLAGYEAVQQFYDLLGWMNGPDSPYETNDSRLRAPRENRQRDLADKAVVRDGMLMFFFRELPLNLSADSVAWSARYQRHLVDQHEVKPTPNPFLLRFAQRCVEELSKINPDSLTDCLGVQFMPAVFLHAPVREDEKYGNQVVFRFWVWGDTDEEVMGNLTYTVTAISSCLRKIDAEQSRR
jgi:hypothetical protein